MEKRDANYRLTFRFGLISFFAVGMTAAFIFLFFRYQTIQIIEDSSRRSNEVLTVATEYALNDHFVMFLNFVDQDNEITNKNVALSPVLSKAIQKLLLDTNVVRLKIYNTGGTVVYSTKASQIGDGHEDNPGFKKALEGETTTVLVYRDTFNLFDREAEDANLVQTYVPIKLVTTGEVKGVFEVYSDVSDYIYLSDRTILLVSIIVLFLMFILYAFLLFHIKRSENIINDQNRETRERNRMLEFLTAKMINAQEDERRRIAHELHEDVVQTISGVKMQLERYMSDLAVEEGKDTSTMDSTRSIVPVLQEAAQKIRMVAMDLRPPSLDDFGLKAAINSLISECHASTMGTEVTLDFSLSERDLTNEKKSILYRMLKDALKSLCFKHGMRGHAAIALTMSEGQLTLQITAYSEKGFDFGYESLPEYLESVQERTILSGGRFDFNRKGDSIESVSVWTQ
ncbi:MAG: histidine kinase [Candidatus Thiodiazotropha sp.]|jgi:signal transduction histidine kinase